MKLIPVKLDGTNHNKSITTRKQYLVKIDSEFHAGRFSKQWYGWNFDNWGESGIQLDSDCIAGVWEIRQR